MRYFSPFPDQTTVDGDALFSSISCRSGSLQSLRPCQIHKVEFGCQRFKLTDVGVVCKTVVRHIFLEMKRRDTEYMSYSQALFMCEVCEHVRHCLERTHELGTGGW